MPYLKIDSCTECPFKQHPHGDVGEDSYRIRCGHPDVPDHETQIRSCFKSYGIFFPCPLPKEMNSDDE